MKVTAPYTIRFTDVAVKNILKKLLSDEELLADYLDYLHAQTVKEETEEYFTLAEVRELLAQDQ